MKKRLENLTNNWKDTSWWANGATNLATNTLAVAGAAEGVNYMQAAELGGSTIGLAAAGAGIALYKLNDSNLVKKAASKVNSKVRSINWKPTIKGRKINVAKGARNVALAAYLTASGIAGYNVVKDVAQDFSSGKEKIVVLPTPIDTNKIPMPNNKLIEGQELAPRQTTKGKFQRTYRWDELLDKTEAKYNIEKGLLAGLCMREGYGNPLQLNSGGDGGAGMIQMQPGMAQHYGLKTFGKSKRLGRDTKHGKKLKNLLDSIGYDYVEAAKLDDRFNPAKNIDAAGKMISDYHKIYNSWDKAISAYNVGQKKSHKVPTNTSHVKHIREFQKFYNKHDKVKHK